LTLTTNAVAVGRAVESRCCADAVPLL